MNVVRALSGWALSLTLGCGAPGPTPDVVLGLEQGLGPRVDARYLSFTVDASKVVSPTGAHYDFERPALRKLAAQLGRSMLRVGGTVGDVYYYDLSDDPITVPPPGFQRIMTREIWDGVCAFARDLELELMFTLNAGPGPRDDGNAWTPDNARALVEYSVAHDCPVSVWELGNEINGLVAAFGFDAYVSGKQYARDTAVARALLDDVAPGTKLAGPALAYWPEWGEMVPILKDFAARGLQNVDILTWHYYPQQSSNCPIASLPAERDTLLAPRHLDEVHRWAEEVETAAQGTPVWLGETSHAQCGGEDGLSDTYVTGFWWLDELGAVARRGHQRIFRQALTGGVYALARDEDLVPRPDYYTSVLWQRLMGAQVLLPTAAHRDTLRVYSHCAPNAGVTFALINLHAQEVVVDFDAFLGQRRHVYRLTADDLLDATVSLNGTVLATTAQGELPALEPSVEQGPIALPALSYGFVHLPDAACPGSP